MKYSKKDQYFKIFNQVLLLVSLLITLFFSQLTTVNNNSNTQNNNSVLDQDNLTDSTQWFALFLSGKKSGYSKIQRIVEDDIVTTSVTTLMQINRDGDLVSVENTEKSIETIDGKALSFNFKEIQGSHKIVINGVVSDNGEVNITIKTPSQTVQKKQIWGRETLLFEGQRLKGLEQGLKVGTRFKMNAYMISALQVIKTNVVIGETKSVDLLGRVVNLTEVFQSLDMGAVKFSVKGYSDRQQNIKKIIMPMMGSNMELIATSEQYALSTNQPSDFFTRSFTASPSAITQELVNRPLSYSISAGNDQVLFSDTSEQIVSKQQNGKITITVSPIKNTQGEFPYTGANKALLKYLESNIWAQSNNKLVTALAKLAIGNTDSATIAAQKIEDFVRTYISDKNLSVGYATAVEVLESKQGDCTEHALLLVAMLKAVGIPARVATGVTYVERFAKKQQMFVPHAWAQAHIDGKWLSFDAALSGFDSGHITLAYGSGEPFEFFKLINTIGNFEITAISPQTF